MKILNLYSGIGGNRKHWGNDHEITAVELDPKIAAIYKDFFPGDTVIVGDAHQYLLEHYKEFDFIWSSPPCPSHSITNYFLNEQGIIRYPDMALWQEIIFLKHFCKSKYCVENVKSYYEPLIKPQISGRHYFWANFTIPLLAGEAGIGRFGPVKSFGGKHTEGFIFKSGVAAKGKSNTQYKDAIKKMDYIDMDISKYSGIDKKKVSNNCVSPEIGLAILESVQNIYKDNSYQQIGLFKTV